MTENTSPAEPEPGTIHTDQAGNVTIGAPTALAVAAPPDDEEEGDE